MISGEQSTVLLKKHYERTGRCSPGPKGHPLYHWVSSQRRYRRQGKPSYSSNSYRVRKLDEIKFRWLPKETSRKITAYTSKKRRAKDATAIHILPQATDPESEMSDSDDDESWEILFETAKRYHSQHGHFGVPKSHILDPWIKSQRRHRATGGLSQTRHSKLEGIGFTWKENENRSIAKIWSFMMLS